MPLHPTRVAVAGTLTAAGLVLAGCGGEPTSRDATEPPAPTTPATTASASEPAKASPPSATPGRGLAITTGDSDFGTMLFDRAGQAIYLFDKETTRKAKCYGACAKAWPPVLTENSARAAGAVRPRLLGTTDRTDGSTQVTYAGHPLYYYAHEGPHQVLCHNVTEFGGRWLVVTPNGTPAG